ncbi:MAG: hypothetical protein R3D85_10545 [Paracoccaceae bacterium]
MMLTLLHTSPVHVATFDALRDRIAPGAPLSHIVREDLLDRARVEGVTPAIASETTALIQAAPGPVLCTCTTLGEVAEAAGALRIDRPMMQAAARTGGQVLLVYCLDSTAQASRALLEDEMAQAGNSAGIEPLSLAPAWPLFEAGDLPAFAQAVAEGIRAAISDRTACIVLAQASMAGAATLLEDTGLPVLASPEIALRTALSP